MAARCSASFRSRCGSAAFPPTIATAFPLGMRCILVEHDHGLVLIDCGAGNKENARFLDIYGIENSGANGRTALEDALAVLGHTPDDIAIVIDSHLHFDHGGGNTYRDEAGAVWPTFPRARYVVQRGELDYASHTNERTAASYFPHNFAPIVEAGLFDLVEGEKEIVPGITRDADAGPRAVPSRHSARVQGRARVLSRRSRADGGASATALDHGLRRGTSRDTRDEASHAGESAQGGVAAASSSTTPRTRGGASRTTARRTRWRRDSAGRPPDVTRRDCDRAMIAARALGGDLSRTRRIHRELVSAGANDCRFRSFAASLRNSAPRSSTLAGARPCSSTDFSMPDTPRHGPGHR